mmetsp:Transcript_43445/g.104967  ORF Transcript_43445/g.104967 Transcript_43445/m.104967 type:complete len:102 (-) Transcript_43445:203-508(-)
MARNDIFTPASCTMLILYEILKSQSITSARNGYLGVYYGTFTQLGTMKLENVTFLLLFHHLRKCVMQVATSNAAPNNTSILGVAGVSTKHPSYFELLASRF